MCERAAGACVLAHRLRHALAAARHEEAGAPLTEALLGGDRGGARCHSVPGPFATASGSVGTRTITVDPAAAASQPGGTGEAASRLCFQRVGVCLHF